MLFLSSTVIAETEKAESMGEFAQELMGPVTVLSSFIGNASIIIGVMAVFGALLRYMQYKANPLASPISTVFVLLILGILLICLPFTYLLTGAGIPFFEHGSAK
jgi:hypothetical protein